MELSRAAKGYSLASWAHSVCRSFWLAPHPSMGEPHRFVPDKLCRADGLINRGLLGLVRSQLVVQHQHADPVCEQLPGWRSPAWLFKRRSEPRPTETRQMQRFFRKTPAC